MDIIYVDEPDTGAEPINTDYEHEPTSERPPVEYLPLHYLTLERMTEAVAKQHRPIERKTRTVRKKNSIPLHNTVFATVEDYLAAAV